MSNLEFVNHACFFYENIDFIFICDPWVEGTAFNDGWNLLDCSTSNKELISKLSKNTKDIYIWYSHEHSDHFSISFLKELKGIENAVKIFFQNTFDKRVKKYLKANKYKIKELKIGDRFYLDEKHWINLFPWKSGDSFLIMHFDNSNIMNLNDCITSSEKDFIKIKNYCQIYGIKNIDILFAQFGIANWCGNEFDNNYRKAEAHEKLVRISNLIKYLNPKNVVLFASYIFFCNDYNFYLNEDQNTPNSVRENHSLKKYNNRIFFLKPRDRLKLDGNVSVYLKEKTKEAETHWQNLHKEVKPIINKNKFYELFKIRREFKKYQKKIFFNFLGIFSLLEYLGLIKSIKFKVNDLGKIIKLSYIHKLQELKNNEDWDISVSSEDLFFSISNDFGFDCLQVNGRYRTKKYTLNNKLAYFAGPQNMLKNGYGWKRPLNTIQEFLRLARK